MKSLLIIPSIIRGGVEEYTLKIASASVILGWNVHVAFPNSDGTKALVQELLTAGVQYHRLEIEEKQYRNQVILKKYFKKYLPYFVRTILLLLKVKPDVVQIILPLPDHCFGSIMACGFLKIPTIIRFGLVPPIWQTPYSPKKLKAYTWARNRNQQLLAISQNNRRLVANLFQIPEHQILCIYNGASIKPILGTNKTNYVEFHNKLTKEIGICENSQLLLTVGRLHEQKGYMDIIPIIPHIIKEFPDVKFIWIGEGEQRKKLSSQIREYGVESKVFMLGYRSDVRRWLQAANLFVFPTHYEGGQSHAIAEAMAYGLPIIASDASGIPEVIEHGVHGLLFRTGDTYDLLEKLRWSLRNPDRMKEIAKNAKTHAQEFSEERMVQETLEVWHKLIQTSVPNL
ncbi:MAG: glycosyltransferase family 4 protein [Pelatocladus maniniholoensis HA4357-MV3]|jgi:glycosyltransferase involved in cell wall biosynthesis|uniref:Glycosyltransferase family 4 protein n=1 Tax=Pelatocladus maniniholoensis HA4357-MV3 TaxID=1117104 RepID=A0A9E3H7K3_9NOST|nr:glycosyltransferase family 4 protein [Pelatocladus maniniholoensis HA4357-MV3]BAZ66846.1 group 1 glycosyl transferase [Fischerella sp. NIES-4106]